jgi:hypothetical protein
MSVSRPATTIRHAIEMENDTMRIIDANTLQSNVVISPIIVLTIIVSVILLVKKEEDIRTKDKRDLV